MNSLGIRDKGAVFLGTSQQYLVRVPRGILKKLSGKRENQGFGMD